MSGRNKNSDLSPTTVDVRPRAIGWVALPLALFASVAFLFAVALKPGGDPSRLPSVLIGKPSPAYKFAAIDGLGAAASGFDQTALTSGRPTILNFWASWCAPCVDENTLLLQLAKRQDLAVVGVNVKDAPGAAKQFLTRYGNPFSLIGADSNGRGSIEWGVYGTPETFILNGRGQIIYKHIGPITQADLETKILPAIDAAKR
jgi:cytochrome c biogenesis protein CcmG, thiol:disulfide interchange protein DsbE